MARKLRVAFAQVLTTEMMGIMQVSAVLRQAGHETRMFMDSQEPDIAASVLAWQPDVFGISIITGMHVWALHLSARRSRTRRRT